MGAQFWDRIAYCTRCLVKFEWKSSHLDSPMPGVRHRHDHLLRQDLRIRKHISQIHHHAARYASGVQRLNPMRLRSLSNTRVDQGIDGRTMLHAEIVRAEIRVIEQRLECQRL